MKKQFNGYEVVKGYIDEERRMHFDIVFKAWENYGKKRIYFQANSSRAQTTLKGYIDCNNENAIIIDKCTYPFMKNAVTEFVDTYEF